MIKKINKDDITWKVSISPSLMYHFIQMSLEVERKPQRRREKSKAHPLFLPRRKARTQEKKGNKTYFSIINTEHVSTDRTFSTPSSFHSCSSSNTNSRSEPSDDTPGSFVNAFPRAANTSDPIRVKCREMLANALQTGGKPAAVAFAQILALDFIYSPLSISPLRWLHRNWRRLWRTRSTDRRLYPSQWMERVFFFKWECASQLNHNITSTQVCASLGISAICLLFILNWLDTFLLIWQP